jgi:hypothetical protein
MWELFEEYPECLSKLKELIILNDLDCSDSYRMAFTDDAYQKVAYNEAATCCGTFNAYMKVDGREVIIGCNYGH